MNQDNLLLVLAAIVSVLPGCSFNKSNKPQLDLHGRLHAYYQKALDETSTEIKESADILVECMNNSTICKATQSAPGGSLSSIFVPSFSKKGVQLHKFLEASQSLEVRWDDFLKTHNYISWIYAFDDISGALRISPATATDMTYGRKMDFRKFEFYQSAKEKLPDVVWQDKPKEDVSGTGSILIVSTARKIGKGIKVVSGDIKVSSLAHGSNSELNKVIIQRKTKSLLFFAYIKAESGMRSLLSEYATDQAQWLSIRSFPSQNDNFLRISPENKKKILDIERLVESKSGANVHLEKVVLLDSSFSCSVSKIQKPLVMLWLCIQ